MKMLSLPRLVDALRPSLEEIEYYARLILEHEGRPLSALPDCQREAELQLWAMRSSQIPSRRRTGRRAPAQYADMGEPVAG